MKKILNPVDWKPLLERPLISTEEIEEKVGALLLVGIANPVITMINANNSDNLGAPTFEEAFQVQGQECHFLTTKSDISPIETNFFFSLKTC